MSSTVAARRRYITSATPTEGVIDPPIPSSQLQNSFQEQTLRGIIPGLKTLLPPPSQAGIEIECWNTHHMFSIVSDP